MTSNYGEYKLSPVGSGGFGQVYLALKDNDTKAYILKTLKEGSVTIENIEFMKKEIEIIIELNKEPKCDYIPTLYDYYKENIKSENNNNKDIKKSRPYYVIDYYSRGNLFYYLKHNEKGLLEKYAKVIFKKIVKAIQFCHNRNICHLDIKPANIILDNDFNPIIIDFGLSNKIRNDKNEIIIYEGDPGTIDYKCPEMWERNRYKGVESDIFSLGVILFNLVTSKPGFITSQKNDSFYKYIIHNKGNYESYWKEIRGQISKDFSKEFKELYVKMVAFHPSERPSINEILKSNWLKEINDLNENEEDILEKEVRDELIKIYDDIKDNNKEIKIAEQIQEKGYTTRSFDNNTKYFDNKLKPKKISNDRININHYLIFDGKLSVINFMNSLVNAINNNFGGNSLIESSEENLKFEVIFENEEESQGNCVMDIELFEYENGKYLLEFLRKGGEIPEYYNYFLKIKEIIMKYLL